MRIKIFMLFAFMLFGCGQAFSQEIRKEIFLDFRINKGTLDTIYMNNAERLSEVISFLEEFKSDSALDMIAVSFCGSASPEGTIAINRRLSAERSKALEEYVRSHISLPDSIIVRCKDVFAWDRLIRLVEESDMQYKDEVLNILLNVPEYTYNNNGAITDSRKKHLMDLQGGRAWQYMLKHFYPHIRNASVVFIIKKQPPVEKPEGLQAMETLEEQRPVFLAGAIRQRPPVAQGPEKPFYMAVKTNMLYDVAAVPNVGVEFYLGKNWSITGNWMYGWWNSDRHHRFWRIYGGELGVRKWFGKKADEKPLTGHHLGVYGQVFTYDFEWGGKGYMGGAPGKMMWNTPNYAVGIEYGYSLPIARRLNIDFTIGLGYWGGRYYVYTPHDSHYVWETTKNRHWFGPTKAEISLVWLLGRGNVNNMKGGAK